jgi:hypothetical protein
MLPNLLPSEKILFKRGKTSAFCLVACQSSRKRKSPNFGRILILTRFQYKRERNFEFLIVIVAKSG